MPRQDARSPIGPTAERGRRGFGIRAEIDPGEVWRNLVAIDPCPPGPLAVPPYVLALPDDRMDDHMFFQEAKRLYLERSGLAPLDVVFRPIPRSTPVGEITFVLPDRGMSEREFAEKAIRVHISLEAGCRAKGTEIRWA